MKNLRYKERKVQSSALTLTLTLTLTLVTVDEVRSDVGSSVLCTHFPSSWTNVMKREAVIPCHPWVCLSAKLCWLWESGFWNQTSLFFVCHFLGFPGGSDSRGSACNAGDPGLIPRWGRSCGEGKGNPLQYSCLENPMDRGDWWATVHGITKSRTPLSS